MRKVLVWLLLVMLMAGAACAETLQECHRVSVTREDTKQKNGSVIRLWKLDTAQDSVDAALQEITAEYVERIAPALPKAGNATGKNSRLDVAVRYSRTSLTWMSVLVQARTTCHRELVAQEFTSCTYT